MILLRDNYFVLIFSIKTMEFDRNAFEVRFGMRNTFKIERFQETLEIIQFHGKNLKKKIMIVNIVVPKLV